MKIRWKTLNHIFLIIFLTACGTDFESEFCPSLDDCSDSSSGSGGSVSAVYSTIFSDDYNRADGALGANYVIIEDGGTRIDISSSEVRLGRNNITGVTPVGLYNSSLSQVDVRITVDFRIGGTLAAGNGFLTVFGRSQSTSDQYQDSYECRINTGDGKLDLYVYSGSAPSLLATSGASTAPLNNGDTYQIIFTLEGNSLQCEVTGSATLSVSASDNSHSSGYYGAGGGIENAIEIYMDDLLIEGKN